MNEKRKLYFIFTASNFVRRLGGAETSYAREPLENKCTKKSPVGADMGPPPLYLDPIERYFLTLISGAVDSPRNVPSAFA